MKLLTKAIREKLLANGRISAKNPEAEFDPRPVVKIFTPDAGATWLLTELDPEGEDMAFGLCDLGLGSPELGYVSMSELASVRGTLGLKPERDKWFKPEGRGLADWASKAKEMGSIP